MNQILQTREKNNNNQPTNIKKVILFFAIAIMILGGILLAQGAKYIYAKNRNNQPIESVVNKNAVIGLTKTDDRNLIISIESKVAISSFIYTWNDEETTTIDALGKTYIEETINIPIGNNTLYIETIDIEGNTTAKTETFNIEASEPIISLSIIGNNLKISVTSEIEISNVSYKWNSEEAKEEDMFTYEDKNNFEKIISIPKGNNTLKIEVTDINNRTVEMSKIVKGVTRAKTTVTAKDGYLEFVVTGEDNIKNIDYEFNGVKYTLGQETFGKTNTVKYKVELKEGMNYLKVISTTENDVVDTSLWKVQH